MKEHERKKSTDSSPNLNSSYEDLKTYGSCYDLFGSSTTSRESEVVFVSDSELDEIIKDLTGCSITEQPSTTSD